MLNSLSLLALLAGFALVLPSGNLAAETSQTETSVAYDVFAVPPSEIKSLVSQTGEELQKRGLQSLYRRGFMPHVTLYLTRYAARDLPAVRQRVQQLASQSQAFVMQAAGCSLTPSHWLFLDVRVDATLQSLSDQAVMRLSPLHDPHLPEPGWLKDVPQKREAFLRFGSPNVFGGFEPHLTQLAHENSPSLSQWFAEGTCKGRQAQGLVKALGLAPVDTDGQILENQAELFPLKAR